MLNIPLENFIFRIIRHYLFQQPVGAEVILTHLFELTDSARSIVSSYKAFEKDVKNYAHDSFVRFFPEDPKLL